MIPDDNVSTITVAVHTYGVIILNITISTRSEGITFWVNLFMMSHYSFLIGIS